MSVPSVSFTTSPRLISEAGSARRMPPPRPREFSSHPAAPRKCTTLARWCSEIWQDLAALAQQSIVLESPAAKVSSERHQGAFAEGAALSMGEKLQPLDPAPMKTVRLDTTHKIIEIAPGVKFSAWTFGDQVPGPTLRARVGDRIKFTMTNRSDEPAPGVRLTAAPMMHSMDFHAAMVSPQDKYRSIAPGQTIEFQFVANYSGIFMYD